MRGQPHGLSWGLWHPGRACQGNTRACGHNLHAASGPWRFGARLCTPHRGHCPCAHGCFRFHPGSCAGHRHRGHSHPQPHPCHGEFPRDSGKRSLCGIRRGTPAHCGQGHDRPAFCERSCKDATSACGRRHRPGQECVPQCHAHKPSLAQDARGAQAPPCGSEARGNGHLRGRVPPCPPSGQGSGGRQERAFVGSAGDGPALQPDVQALHEEHSGLQRQTRLLQGKSSPGTGGSCAHALYCHCHRRAGRPHASGPQGCGALHHTPGPARQGLRHPHDHRYPAPQCGCGDRPYQGQLPEPYLLPRLLAPGQHHDPGAGRG